MDIRIKSGYASGEIARLSNVLRNKDVDVLAMQDGATCDGGITGVTYSHDCMKIFQELSWFFLGDAHEDGVKFDSVDSYVWYAIEKYAEEILNDWAAMEHIVQCTVCERWEYVRDSLEHNDEYVCSRTCLASAENAETEDDA